MTTQPMTKVPFLDLKRQYDNDQRRGRRLFTGSH